MTDDLDERIGENDQDLHARWTRNIGERRGPGAPLGNTNGRKGGAYVAHFLSDDEVPLYQRIIDQLHADFVFNQSSDLMQVELVAVYFIRLARAQANGDSEAAERFDRMIRAHLKDLKTTKLAREGDQPKKPETTPAEWATRVLEKSGETARDSSTGRVQKRGETGVTSDGDPAEEPEE